MEAGKLILSLRARPQNLAHLRALVAGFLQAVDARAETAADAKISVSEVATNAILHGYEGSPGELEIEARSDGDKIVIAILDRGRGSRTSPRTSPETGRGIPLVEALCERIDVERSDEGTRVELVLSGR